MNGKCIDRKDVDSSRPDAIDPATHGETQVVTFTQESDDVTVVDEYASSTPAEDPSTNNCSMGGGSFRFTKHEQDCIPTLCSASGLTNAGPSTSNRV